MNIKMLITTKTFWAGVSAIAVGAYLIFKEKQIVEGMQMAIGGVGMIFIREGIAKVGK